MKETKPGIEKQTNKKCTGDEYVCIKTVGIKPSTSKSCGDKTGHFINIVGTEMDILYKKLMGTNLGHKKRWRENWAYK